MPKIVAVTGMPGAGKSTAAEALAKKGWARVVMGDVIRSETKRRGLDPDAVNTGNVMKALRQERGEAAVAELCLEAMERSKSQKVVVDGIRSMAEVDAFRKKAEVLLVAIHASPSRRFELLRERGRRDDPLSRKMFDERDRRELRVGIGDAISLSDEVISNQHMTPERLEEEMMKVVDRWVKDVSS